MAMVYSSVTHPLRVLLAAEVHPRPFFILSGRSVKLDTGKAMKAADWNINPDIATGMLVPVTAASVWLGVRCTCNSMHTL